MTPTDAPVSTALEQFNWNVEGLAGYLVFVVGMQGSTLHGLMCGLMAVIEQLPEDKKYIVFPEKSVRALSIFHKDIAPSLAHTGGPHNIMSVELGFCRLIDYYLIYVAELLGLIFRAKPQVLKSNETITIASILEYSTFDDLIEHITERRVLELSFKGVSALNGYLRERLSFELFENEEDLKRTIRIIETRNVLVHNRGIVNRLFLSRVWDAPEKLGQRVTVTGGLAADLKFLIRICEGADARAAAKFGVPRHPKREPTKVHLDIDDLYGALENILAGRRL